MAERRPRLDLLTPEERAYICAELCNHLVAARQFDRLNGLLVNLDYLAQRCDHDGVDGVLRDFGTARLAEAQPWDSDAPQAQFARFFSRSAHLLRLAPALIWQEARNSTEIAVTRSAEASRGLIPADPALRRLTPIAPDRHTGQVLSLAFLGSDLLVSTTAPEVWAWDCATGRVRTRFQAPPAPAKSLAVSPDRRFVAAGFGAQYPVPDVAGVQVWSRDGGVVSTRRLTDWVYTTRWRGPTEIIAGGGEPTGEGSGKIWRIDVEANTCSEIGKHLADRPIVLTWDPVPGDPEQLMALVQDGVVLYLWPGYRPISDQEYSELTRSRPEDEDYWEARDQRMLARRPVAGTIAAPLTDLGGYWRAADTFRHSNSMVCLLGQSLPIPSGLAWVAAEVPADGIYLLDMEARSYGVIDVPKIGRDSGYRMLCIAASPVDRQVVVGDANGCATLLPVDSTKSRVMHRGGGRVTALCFDDAGELLAVGDSKSNVVVYEVASGEVRMRTPVDDQAIAADADLVLFHDRLEIKGTALALTQGHTGVDFARWGDLAVVLCTNDATDGKRPDLLALADLERHEWLFNLPTPAPIKHPKPGNGTSPPFQRVEVSHDAEGLKVHLGSLAGVCSGLLLAPDTCTALTLPHDVINRERNMAAIRVDRESGLVCDRFAPVPGGVLCAYTDNDGFPVIAGELHLLGSRHAEVMRFASTITALAAGPEIVVVGTDGGEAAALLRVNDTWQRLSAVDHPGTVTAVAVTSDLACSASQDGLIMVWRLHDGARVLMASADIKPIAVALTGTHVRAIDAAGREHAWGIENFNITERPVPPAGPARYMDALRLITLAGQLAVMGDGEMATSLLGGLPDIPQRDRIREQWTGMYRRLAMMKRP